MSQPAAHQDALGALERLYAKNVITLEEGQAAARAIARDENYQFPQPPPPAPAPAAQPEAPAQAPSETHPGPPEDAPGQNGDGTSPG